MLSAREAGKRLGKVVKVQAVDDGKAVVVKAEDATPEQVAKWAAAKEASKAKAKQKAAAKKAESNSNNSSKT
jgi:hypothetical protein